MDERNLFILAGISLTIGVVIPFLNCAIFDLSECYRSATDREVESFATSSKLALDNSEVFKGMTNTWIFV